MTIQISASKLFFSVIFTSPKLSDVKDENSILIICVGVQFSQNLVLLRAFAPDYTPSVPILVPMILIHKLSKRKKDERIKLFESESWTRFLMMI